jgi:GNAT superfamily N-acetyltransferase
MESRPATPGEIEAVVHCVTLAFASDPVWEPALRRADGRTDHHAPYWRLFVEGAMRYGTVRTTPAGEAVSVWLPPGGSELTEAQQADLERLLATALDDAARAAMSSLYGRFEASRAPLPDHYYLSLLATHPDHRGRGIGQALLAADLAVWDAAGVPSYLESTNPGNDHRYARAGFRPIGGFAAVRDGAWVSAMWRDVGGPRADTAWSDPGIDTARRAPGRIERSDAPAAGSAAATDHG